MKLAIRKAELVTFNIILKKRYYNYYVSTLNYFQIIYSLSFWTSRIWLIYSEDKINLLFGDLYRLKTIEDQVVLSPLLNEAHEAVKK